MRSPGSILAVLLIVTPVAGNENVLDSPAARFATDTDETPDFQRHVVPLLGKLGCNGRACHGSFQGRGGFRLSLFGYDFDSDHEELSARSDSDSPSESLMLQKPLAEIEHEGGQRFQSNSWQHRLLLNWIRADAPARPKAASELTGLEVTPSELLFHGPGEDAQLSAVAVWSDGTREDVTELCRFQSNDDQIADINTQGLVKSGSPGDTHLVVFYDNAVVPVTVLSPVSERTGDSYPATPTPTKVDQLVVTRLKKLGIIQSDLCTDEEFLRRASLDATGTLPSVTEIRAFLADSSPDKRTNKIDELLERPGYTAWWTTRLCDFTGNSDDQLNNVTPVRTAASQHWYDWIHSRVQENVGYDDIVEGMVMAVSRDEGESYEDYCTNMSRLYHKDDDYGFHDRETLPHYWSRRNFQQMEDRVIGFSYAFLGVRIQCAQCHKHPFDQWTQQDFKQFQGFFSGVVGRNQNPSPKNRDQYQSMLAEFETGDLKGNQLRNELGKLLKQGETVPFGEVFTRPAPKQNPRKNKKNAKPKKKKKRRGNQVAREARLLGDDSVDLTRYNDVREPLMDWLRDPANPLFARAFVNRVWANYFNVGIVNPPDDMNLANPPSNAALLDYLATEFIAHDFDMKWLHREILNSRTYQLSWKPNETNGHDDHNFSRAIPRRLPAEVSWDIVSQAASSGDKHLSYVSNMRGRAVAVPGAGIRYQRRGNNPHAYPLSIFGRSVRDSNCDCDRSEDPSLLQTIFMRNDSQLLALLDSKDSWLAEVAAAHNNPFQAKVTANPNNDKAKMKQQAKALQAIRTRLKQQQRQLQKLKDKDSPEKQIAQVEKRIGRLKKRLESPQSERGNPQPQKEPDAPSRIDLANAVEEAYLRTLSRRPTETESETATQFISQSTNQIDGLRDVMWALLNTKEFIVNH